MAYNNGYYPQYYQPNLMYQNPPSYTQQNQQPQIQNGGFMVVQSEEIARTYPVALGNCVTFKIEGKPIVMEKSMGFSQLDSPKLTKYRLVKEEDMPQDVNAPAEAPQESEMENKTTEEIKGQIQAINNDIEQIKKRLEELEDLGA